MGCGLNNANSCNFLCPAPPNNGFGGGGGGGTGLPNFGGIGGLPFINGSFVGNNGGLGNPTGAGGGGISPLDTICSSMCPDDDQSSSCCPKDCGGCGRCNQNSNNNCLQWLPCTVTVTQIGDWNNDGDKVPVSVTFVNNLEEAVYIGMNDYLCGFVAVPGLLRAHATYTMSTNVYADTSLLARPNQKYVRLMPYIQYLRPNDSRVQTCASDSFAWRLCRAAPQLSVIAFFMNTTINTTTLIIGIDNNSKKTLSMENLPITMSGNPTVYSDITPIQSPPTLTPTNLSTGRFPNARFFAMQQQAVGGNYVFDLVSQPAYLANLPGSNWTAFSISGSQLTTTDLGLIVTIGGGIDAKITVMRNSN